MTNITLEGMTNVLLVSVLLSPVIMLIVQFMKKRFNWDGSVTLGTVCFIVAALYFIAQYTTGKENVAYFIQFLWNIITFADRLYVIFKPYMTKKSDPAQTP